MSDLPTVSASEAHAEMLTGAVFLVDIRRPDEWEATGVPANATLITMQDPRFLEQIEELTGGNLAARLLLTCRSGARSANVQHALSERGYTNVVNVRGGFLGNGSDLGWSQAGLPSRTYSGD